MRNLKCDNDDDDDADGDIIPICRLVRRQPCSLTSSICMSQGDRIKLTIY